MDNCLIIKQLRVISDEKQISLKYQKILEDFYKAVQQALLKKGKSTAAFDEQFVFFIKQVATQLQQPHSFQSYHPKIRTPTDYYQFGIEFIRPLVDLENSKVFGLDVLSEITNLLNRGENVVLISNHQTELDPQVISLLLEKTHSELAEKIIYVAGDRVTSDPIAVPFSLGCDLLCIHSKRYLNYPPEKREQKLQHNRRTIEQMSKLLAVGGKIIYVAPSGGRDRKNSAGVVEVAPFDAQSVEIFNVVGTKAKVPTHLYPFTLSTFPLLPPPPTIQQALGEERIAQYTPIMISFCLPPAANQRLGASKAEQREARAAAFWHIVSQEYKRLETLM